MNYLLGLFCAVLGVAVVHGANKGEWCPATIDCDDVGLACSGQKCHCLIDFSLDTAKVWSCNKASDCNGIAEIAIRHVEESVRRRARAPVCTPSTQCAHHPDFSGYCDVTMDA